MGASLVVVLNEDGQDGFEVALVADQQPVQALGSDGADPSLGVGVGPRRLDGGSDDAGVLSGEDLVEAGHELGVAVTDQELDVFVVVGQGGGQVAGGLGDPVAGRVGSDAGQPDPATFEVDEEQHVEPAETDGVHGEEVAGHHAWRLGAEELDPGRPAASWCGAEVVAAHDGAHRGGRDDQAELGALAFDALVSPAGVVSGQTQHRVDNSGVKTSPFLVLVGVDPVSGDELAMPAHQRGWGDHED